MPTGGAGSSGNEETPQLPGRQSSLALVIYAEAVVMS